MKQELYYCKGSIENPAGVIKALEEKGGINSKGYAGDSPKSYYYICNNIIDYCLYPSSISYLLKEYGTKLQPRTEFPRSWEEFCKVYDTIEEECYINSMSNINIVKDTPRGAYEDRNLFSTEQEAEAFLALIQLRRLREVWIGNWTSTKEDWAYIYNSKDGIQSSWYNTSVLKWEEQTRVLSFPTQKMAKEFIECFKDLLEKAKDLL